MARKSELMHEKKRIREIAKARAVKYINMADEVFLHDKKLADRYVSLARSTAMKYQVTIPRDYKRKFCRHCHSYLRPGINLRVRMAKGKRHAVYYCLECRKHMRLGIGKKDRKDL